jgi:iron complex outermembrane recepter protein
MASRMACAMAVAVGLTVSPWSARAQNDDFDALFGSDSSLPWEPEPTSPAESTAAGDASSAPEPYPETVSVAQEPVPDTSAPAGPRPASRLVEEIVVTAQKREQNLQDVPLSVAAFSGGQLEALGVDNPRDLGNITPGFVSNENLGFALYNIRGVGSDIFVPSADTGVATYIDGIYQPLPNGLSADFGKIERVEVLKGPQGTLYGRNTVGGAVNIITRKPADTLEIALRGEVGSFDTRKLKAYVSGPLFSDAISVGISAIRNTSQTYYTPGPRSVVREFADDVSEGINPRLTLRAGDSFDLTLSMMYATLEGPSVLLGTLDPSPAFAPLMAPQADYEVSRDSVEDHWRNENTLYYLEANWRPEPFSVKLLASSQHQEQDAPTGGLDYDQSELPLATAAQRPQFGKVDTAELQFSSTPGGWFSERFIWTLGLYYYKAETGIDPIVLTVLDTDLLDLLGLPLDWLPSLNLGQSLVSRGIVETDALAGYGQVTWEATDWLSLTLGARYQVEDRGLSKASSGVLLPTGQESTTSNYPLDRAKTRRFSPKVSVDVRPFGDDTLLYVSYQEATKSGTFNVINFTAPPSEVRPQDVTAVEIGIKGHLLDGALRYDAAAYRYKIRDFQAQYVSLQSGGALNLYNAPRATSQGFEGNVFWQMFPEWNPGFVLNTGFAVIDARFDHFPNGSGYDEQTGLFFGERGLTGDLAPPRDFSGNRMPSSPELTAVLGLSQTLDIWGGPLEIGVNAAYNSGFFFDAQNTTKGAQPEYTLLGARISYLLESWNLRLSVSGQNLTDTIYYRSRFTSDFGTASQIAPPRAVFFSLGWEL